MQPRLIRHRVGAGVLALAGVVTPVAAQSVRSSSAEPPGASGSAITAPVRRAPRPIIVLESHVGHRPPDVEAITEPLLDELEAHGMLARPASVLSRVGGRAPRPGTLDNRRTAAEIIQPADTGYAAYTRGRFADAEAMLKVALAQIHRNPALLVLDTNNLDATFKILVALALSQAKRGDTGAAVATMLELIRTFRSQAITRADYGPDAEQFYRAVWKQAQAMGRGQLAITVEADHGVVFVNGQIRGLGKAVLPDLIPGVYRVFVQVPGTSGRQYEVEVHANELTELHVEWALDSALWMTDQWLGLVFATEAERARQGGFAGKLARRWHHLIATVGIVEHGGRPSVMASLYDTTGAAVRSAVVALAGADEAKLRALARFLAGGSPGDGVIAIRDDTGGAVGRASPPAPDLAPSLEPELGTARWIPGVLVGAGTATVVTGGVLYAIAQAPMPAFDSAAAGLAVGAAGIAAITVGLWLWRARKGQLATPIVAFSGRAGFVGWAGEL